MRRVLSFVLAFALLFGAFSAVVVSADDCKHENANWQAMDDDSCVLFCEDCKTELRKDWHDYQIVGEFSEEDDYEEYGCTGWRPRTVECSRCGHRYDRTIEPLGHNYVNGVCTRCEERCGHWDSHLKHTTGDLYVLVCDECGKEISDEEEHHWSLALIADPTDLERGQRLTLKAVLTDSNWTDSLINAADDIQVTFYDRDNDGSLQLLRGFSGMDYSEPDMLTVESSFNATYFESGIDPDKYAFTADVLIDDVWVQADCTVNYLGDNGAGDPKTFTVSGNPESAPRNKNLAISAVAKDENGLPVQMGVVRMVVTDADGEDLWYDFFFTDNLGVAKCNFRFDNDMPEGDYLFTLTCSTLTSEDEVEVTFTVENTGECKHENVRYEKWGDNYCVAFCSDCDSRMGVEEHDFQIIGEYNDDDDYDNYGCTGERFRQMKCSKCGYENGTWIEPLGHNYVNGVCTRCEERCWHGGCQYKHTTGDLYILVCSECGKEMSDEEEHHWSLALIPDSAEIERGQHFEIKAVLTDSNWTDNILRACDNIHGMFDRRNSDGSRSNYWDFMGMGCSEPEMLTRKFGLNSSYFENDAEPGECTFVLTVFIDDVTIQADCTVRCLGDNGAGDPETITVSGNPESACRYKNLAVSAVAKDENELPVQGEGVRMFVTDADGKEIWDNWSRTDNLGVAEFDFQFDDDMPEGEYLFTLTCGKEAKATFTVENTGECKHENVHYEGWGDYDCVAICSDCYTWLGVEDHDFQIIGEYNDDDDYKEFGCTGRRYRTMKCSRCGFIKYGWIEPLGHNYVNGVCTRCKERCEHWGYQYKHTTGDLYILVCNECGKELSGEEEHHWTLSVSPDKATIAYADSLDLSVSLFDNDLNEIQGSAFENAEFLFTVKNRDGETIFECRDRFWNEISELMCIRYKDISIFEEDGEEDYTLCVTMTAGDVLLSGEVTFTYLGRNGAGDPYKIEITESSDSCPSESDFHIAFTITDEAGLAIQGEYVKLHITDKDGNEVGEDYGWWPYFETNTNGSGFAECDVCLRWFLPLGEYLCTVTCGKATASVSFEVTERPCEHWNKEWGQRGDGWAVRCSDCKEWLTEEEDCEWSLTIEPGTDSVCFGDFLFAYVSLSKSNWPENSDFLWSTEFFLTIYNSDGEVVYETTCGWSSETWNGIARGWGEQITDELIGGAGNYTLRVEFVSGDLKLSDKCAFYYEGSNGAGDPHTIEFSDYDKTCSRRSSLVVGFTVTDEAGLAIQGGYANLCFTDKDGNDVWEEYGWDANYGTYTDGSGFGEVWIYAQDFLPFGEYICTVTCGEAVASFTFEIVCDHRSIGWYHRGDGWAIRCSDCETWLTEEEAHDWKLTMVPETEPVAYGDFLIMDLTVSDGQWSDDGIRALDRSIISFTVKDSLGETVCNNRWRIGWLFEDDKMSGGIGIDSLEYLGDEPGDYTFYVTISCGELELSGEKTIHYAGSNGAGDPHTIEIIRAFEICFWNNDFPVSVKVTDESGLPVQAKDVLFTVLDEKGLDVSEKYEYLRDLWATTDGQGVANLWPWIEWGFPVGKYTVVVTCGEATASFTFQNIGEQCYHRNGHWVRTSDAGYTLYCDKCGEQLTEEQPHEWAFSLSSETDTYEFGDILGITFKLSDKDWTLDNLTAVRATLMDYTVENDKGEVVYTGTIHFMFSEINCVYSLLQSRIPAGWGDETLPAGDYTLKASLDIGDVTLDDEISFHYNGRNNAGEPHTIIFPEQPKSCYSYEKMEIQIQVVDEAGLPVQGLRLDGCYLTEPDGEVWPEFYFFTDGKGMSSYYITFYDYTDDMLGEYTITAVYGDVKSTFTFEFLGCKHSSMHWAESGDKYVPVCDDCGRALTEPQKHKWGVALSADKDSCSFGETINFSISVTDEFWTDDNIACFAESRIEAVIIDSDGNVVFESGIWCEFDKDPEKDCMTTVLPIWSSVDSFYIRESCKPGDLTFIISIAGATAQYTFHYEGRNDASDPASITVSGNPEKSRTDEHFSVKFTVKDANGKPVQGETVYIVVTDKDGKKRPFYDNAKATTSNEGVATLKLCFGSDEDFGEYVFHLTCGEATATFTIMHVGSCEHANTKWMETEDGCALYCEDCKSFVSDKQAHSWEVKTTQAADCEHDGVKKNVCSHCGAIGSVAGSIPALGHNYEKGVCTRCSAKCAHKTAVWKEGTEGCEHVCSICGETFEKSAHDMKIVGEYTDESDYKAFGCSGKRTRETKCSKCGKTGTTTLDPLGHLFEDGTCKRCGLTVSDKGVATIPEDAIVVEEGKPITIDASSKDAPATSVVLTPSTVDKIAGAETETEIKLSEATMSFNADAIAAISEQAGGKEVKITAETVEKEDLTEAQKEVIENSEVCMVLSLEAFAGEDHISSFGNGQVAISVPFELPQGVTAEEIKVAYIADDGTVTIMPAIFEDGVLTFVTTHFSTYAVLVGSDIPVEPEVVLGDVNGDKKIDPKDCLLTKAMILGTFKTATAAQKKAMDINGDGDIDAKDYLLLKAHILGTRKIR